MQAHPQRSVSAKGGTSSGGWLPATPPARRAGSEIRAPDTLVEAIATRLWTRVRFPPSPPPPEARPARASVVSDRAEVAHVDEVERLHGRERARAGQEREVARRVLA